MRKVEGVISQQLLCVLLFVSLGARAAFELASFTYLPTRTSFSIRHPQTAITTPTLRMNYNPKKGLAGYLEEEAPKEASPRRKKELGKVGEPRAPATPPPPRQLSREVMQAASMSPTDH